jgi:shikimate dehydrogenase
MSTEGDEIFRSLPDGRTRLLGIVGDPLDHSRSPGLHTAVLRELGKNLVYVPVPVSGARLRAFLGLAVELGFVGLNVTTPYKEKVFRLVEAMDEETRRTRMVNTVAFDTAPPRGTGTDGAGVLRWLRWVDAPGPYGVLGFGPTARSIVHRAWEGAPLEVVVTRRPRAVRLELAKWRDADDPRGRAPSGAVDEQRGRAPGRDTDERRGSGRRVAEGRLQGSGPNVVGWKQISEAHLAAVRTWISVLPPAVPLPQRFWELIDPSAVVLDMNYGNGRTDQCDAARTRGHRAADGLGPLLEQAALSLSTWLREDVPVALFQRVAGAAEDELRPR